MAYAMPRATITAIEMEQGWGQAPRAGPGPALVGDLLPGGA
jgi:hypothetical protein